MSFQFLTYKQLRENISQWRREWIDEFDLNAKHLNEEQKRKKSQMDALISFAQQLDGLKFSKGRVDKKDKQENVFADAQISDAKKAKMLTAYLLNLRQTTEIGGQIITQDVLLHESIQFLIGETEKNKIDADAEQEARNALLTLRPLSFAKLCENISKLRDAEIRKYNKRGEFNFEKVPVERRRQFTELQDLINELKEHKFSEQEKEKILRGKLFFLREQIEKTYKEGLLGKFTSMFGSKPEDSELYVGILPALGIQGGKPADDELIRDAKDAFLRFKGKQYAIVSETNRKVEAFDASVLRKTPKPQKVSATVEEKATLTAKELDVIKTTAQVRNHLLSTIDQSRVIGGKLQEDNLAFYYRDARPGPTRQFVNAKTGTAITPRAVARPSLGLQLEPYEKEVSLKYKDIADPYHYIAEEEKDFYKGVAQTVQRKNKVNEQVKQFQASSLQPQPAVIEKQDKLRHVDSEKVEDYLEPVQRAQFERTKVLNADLAGLGDRVQSGLRKLSLLQEAHKTIEKRRNDEKQELDLDESQEYTSPSTSRRNGV